MNTDGPELKIWLLPKTMDIALLHNFRFPMPGLPNTVGVGTVPMIFLANWAC